MPITQFYPDHLSNDLLHRLARVLATISQQDRIAALQAALQAVPPGSVPEFHLDYTKPRTYEEAHGRG